MTRSALAVCVFACALFAQPASAAPVTVAVDRTAVATKLGHTFVIRTAITNNSPVRAAGLIAHLNVLSLGRGLYVDPEDWSSNRTRYLAPLGPGGRTTLTWKLAAVNVGHLGVYVAVFTPGARPVRPTTGRLVQVTIADRRTLDSGGILPLALGIPAGLALLTLVLRLRRRRYRVGGSPLTGS